MSKEIELVRALLMYLSRSIAEQDIDVVRRLGLEPSQLARIADLRAVDIDRLAALQPIHHFMSISFQRAAVCRVLSLIESLRAQESLQKRLLVAGAPRAMMHKFFGMNAHYYANLQATLALPYAGGRTPTAREEACKTVWATGEQLKKQRPDHALRPEDYLRIHQDTGVSLRIIWSILQTEAEHHAQSYDRVPGCTPSRINGASSPLTNAH